MEFDFKDNSEEVKRALEEQAKKALTECGLFAQREAALNLGKTPRRIATGALHNSIATKVDMNEGCVYIGTDMEYAPYVEFGTGIYADDGRKTPWAFKDSKGKWHKTSGMQPSHFLKKAIEENKSTYNQIIRDNLKG